MKELPNPFWALLFMFLGCVLLVTVLFKITANTSQIEVGILMAVATAGSNIISGAFGYINGVQASKNSLQVPMNPDQPPSTITVTPPVQVVPK